MNEYHNCTEGVAVKVTIIYKHPHEMNAIISEPEKKLPTKDSLGL